MLHQFGSNSQPEQESVSHKLINALGGVLLTALLMLAGAPGNVVALSQPVIVPQLPQLSLKFSTLEFSAMQKSGGGYLGVYLGDISEERAKQLKLAEVRGAVVGKVEESSPAAKAGLQENDVILAFNDRQVQNRAQFHQLLFESAPGSKVTLGVSRNGEPHNISVELGQRRSGILDERQRLFRDADAMLAAAEERRKEAEELRKKGDEQGALRLLEEEREFRQQSDEQRAYIEKQLREGKIQQNSASWLPNISVNANRYYLGVSAAPLTEQLAKYFNVTRGVLVSEVRAGGAAERAGIKAGDCIVAVNDEMVTSTADLNRLVDRLGKDDTTGEKSSVEFFLTIVRARNEQKVKVKIEQK
jgi:C-terminal processing protease CtpA/Prc